MNRKEPMFNLSEPSLLMFIGALILVHIGSVIRPIREFLFEMFLLVPMETTYFPVTPVRQAISLAGHGIIHANLNQLLMNAGMILVFGVLTFRGVRALYGYGRKGLIRFWLLFVFGVIGGGLAQWAWWSATNAQESAALGAAGGASALFAAAGWTIGGRDRLLWFGLAWLVLNVALVAAKNLIGQVYWPQHIGGFVIGALLSVYWLKPFSSGTESFR